jgi:hypothetical protein
MNREAAAISNLDYLRRVLSSTASPAESSSFQFPFSIMKTVGMRLIDIGEGTASFEMEANTQLHSNPMGKPLTPASI